MSGYLAPTQVEKLLEAINPRRVSTDGKGFSHVEAYEIRAQLTRIFGFGRWSQDVLTQELIFEESEERRKKNKQGEEYGDPYTVWTVAYRSVVRLTIAAPDGTILCTHTEGATGEAKNQPHRGDAHDLALKTSQSQALKRCAANLGDSFGLSLYRKGSKEALVYRTLVLPAGVPQPADQRVDDHVHDTPPEDEAQAAAPTHEQSTAPQPEATPKQDELGALRERILGGVPVGVNRHKHFAALQAAAAKARLLQARTTDAEGRDVSVKALIDQQMRAA